MVKIITDDGADLPLSTKEKYDIDVLPIAIINNENEYYIGKNITREEMFENMRQKVVYKTSQVTRLLIYQAIEKYVQEGKEVLYLTLSSGISGIYNNAVGAKNDLLQVYPDAKIEIVDSKAATLGQTMVVVRAAMMSKMGLDIEIITKKLEEIIENQIHLFTVGNLEYLYNGGRLSATSKIIGGLLNIMPVLQVDRNDGTLGPIDKARGKKAFFKSLKKWCNKLSLDEKFNPNQTVIISAGEWEEMVEETKTFFIEEMKVTEENIKFGQLGCVIGAHTGPETLTIFFSSNPEELKYIEL